MSRDLDTTVQGIQVAITIFLLVMAALMIPGGKLTDRWGRKRCFTVGLVVYAIGALLSAGRGHLRQPHRRPHLRPDRAVSPGQLAPPAQFGPALPHAPVAPAPGGGAYRCGRDHRAATGRDLAIVAGILTAGLLYGAVYLRRRRDTHWILLDPLISERDVGAGGWGRR